MPGRCSWSPSPGLLVNVAAAAVLFGAERDNLNIRGAFLHVLGDLLGSVAAIVAAVVIMASGWTPIDPLLFLRGRGADPPQHLVPDPGFGARPCSKARRSNWTCARSVPI